MKKRSAFTIRRQAERQAFAEFQRRHGERVARKWSSADMSINKAAFQRRTRHDDRAGIQGEGDV